MKYKQLTKEQFESLHEEFSKFLATQQIDAKEWTELKKTNPEMANQELNIFSDIVWNDVLAKTEYIEHFSPKNINLFKCNDSDIDRLVIKVSKDIDLTKKDGYEWLLKNLSDDTVEFLKGTKKYTDDKNDEIFDLIQKGGSISKGELFSFFNKIINQKT